MDKMTILLLLWSTTALAIIGTSAAFRLELHRVAAPANMTIEERLRCDGMRIHRHFGLVSGATAHVVAQDSGYIAEFGVGNPPQMVQTMVSTSTDPVSTQCSMCRPKCFLQNLDYYDYDKSSTGQPVTCGDTMCVAGRRWYGTDPCTVVVDDSPCSIPGNDGDVAGALHLDEFTLGTAKVNITFACTGQTNVVGNLFGGASGFVGLGRGPLSLVSQVGTTKFSYCLTSFSDRLSSSPLVVGSSAGLTGDAAVTSTPFAINPDWDSSGYYISMSGMSIGEDSLEIPTEAFHGGVIIESSFPYMALVDAAYDAVKSQITRQLGRILVQSPVDFLQLCIPVGEVSLLLDPLVLHLDGGDLSLPTDNYWVQVDQETSCMAVVSLAGVQPPWNGTTIIGSYQQQNFLVLFDLVTQVISFQQADCASI